MVALFSASLRVLLNLIRNGLIKRKKTNASVYLRVSWKITLTSRTKWSYNPQNCSHNELLIVQIFHRWFFMYFRKGEKNKIIWIKNQTEKMEMLWIQFVVKWILLQSISLSLTYWQQVSYWNDLCFKSASQSPPLHAFLSNFFQVRISVV